MSCPSPPSLLLPSLSCHPLPSSSRVVSLTLTFPFVSTYPLFYLLFIVQLLSRIHFFATPWTAAQQASPVPLYLPESAQFIFTDFVMPSNHLILCCPLLLLPSIFNLSQHQGLCQQVDCFIYVALVLKAMAPHSSTLAWKIPWMEEPGRLLRVRHD